MKVSSSGPLSPTSMSSPLHPKFGLEITNVDLSKPLSSEHRLLIDDLLGKEGLLLFRRQVLTEEQLIVAAGALGDLEHIIYSDGISPCHNEVAYVSNLQYTNEKPVGAGGSQIGGIMELKWHSDQTYLAKPATGAMLYAVEVPPPSFGGSTYWANQYLAYESLPEDIKQIIDGKVGMFSYASRLAKFYSPEQMKDEELKKKVPKTALHPIVLTHPVTKRKALYADPVTLAEVQGLSQAQNDRLLPILAKHACEKSLAYQHRWQPGDVVLWDNGCTLHMRDPVTENHPRLLKRMTIFLQKNSHCLPL